MKITFRNISIIFSAGAAGGLINSLVVWIFGVIGITGALGVAIAPGLTPAWLYPRIVWGGIWGVLFLLPILRGSLYLRGMLFSLGPSLVQLLIFFPLREKGLLGLELGTLTPLFVIFFNAVWGIGTALWIYFTERE